MQERVFGGAGRNRQVHGNDVRCHGGVQKQLDSDQHPQRHEVDPGSEGKALQNVQWALRGGIARAGVAG